ncbi:MAG: type II toxin-antitoxin system VapC family toxin [Ferruginibacter sp.]
MTGSNLLLDTNILIYAMKGLADVRPYFDTDPFKSVITEIEILGVKALPATEIKIRETLIEYCTVVPLTSKIKQKVSSIKKQIKIPVPDAIIAATAIEGELTLVTADKGFKRIKELSFVLVEV